MVVKNILTYNDTDFYFLSSFTLKAKNFISCTLCPHENIGFFLVLILPFFVVVEIVLVNYIFKLTKVNK